MQKALFGSVLFALLITLLAMRGDSSLGTGERTHAPVLVQTEAPSQSSVPLGDPVSRVQASSILPASQPKQPDAEVPTALLTMHAHYVDVFAASEGFGYGRMIRKPFHRAGSKQEIESVKSQTSAEKMGSWRVERIDLIGLTHPGWPQAYRTGKLIEMKDLSSVQAEILLEPFEYEGLAALREGRAVWQSQDGASMLGAIYARKGCIQCHSAKDGDLLGAFSYRLKKPDAENDNRK